MERELCCIFVKLVNNISAFFGHINRVYSIKQIDTFIQAVFHTDLYMLLNLLKISQFFHAAFVIFPDHRVQLPATFQRSSGLYHDKFLVLLISGVCKFQVIRFCIGAGI